MLFSLRRFMWSLLLFALYSASAAALEGTVVRISDGDTFVLLDKDNVQHRVRLLNLDAPERGQPWGAKSTDALKAMIAGKAVKIRNRDTDHYGRVLGNVYVGELNVGTEMVRTGNAWVYTRYNTDPSLDAIQSSAQKSKTGLWSLHENERTPPWEWRRAKKNKKKK